MPVIYLLMRRVVSRAARTSVPLILAAMIAVMALGAVAVYHAEHGVNQQFQTFGDALWWSIVTMSTVGYGDIVPITAWGRAFASLVMVSGPVLLASFAASVGVTFYDEWQKGIRGMVRIPVSKHILLCGWGATAAQVVTELRMSEKFRKTPITIVDANLERNPSNDDRTAFVKGNPSEVSALEQANVREAAYAVVVAGSRAPAADQQTVLTVLSIKALSPRVYVCAELIDANNESHLRHAGCDAVVNTGSLTSGLLALSLENPDVNAVIKELASFRGNEVYRVPLPPGSAGLQFVDLLGRYKVEHDAIVVGVDRQGEVRLNPPSDFKLQESDLLLVMAEDEPV